MCGPERQILEHHADASAQSRSLPTAQLGRLAVEHAQQAA